MTHVFCFVCPTCTQTEVKKCRHSEVARCVVHSAFIISNKTSLIEAVLKLLPLSRSLFKETPASHGRRCRDEDSEAHKMLTDEISRVKKQKKQRNVPQNSPTPT